MIEVYYAVMFAILIFTLPLGSRRLVYAGGDNIWDYSPLNGLSDGGRKAAMTGGILIFLTLLPVVILRPETLPDYRMYEEMYSMGGGDRINRDVEASFGVLTQLSPSFLVLLGIYALLSVGTHVFAIFRNSPNIWLSFVIYLTYTFVLHDMIQMRAGVALGVLLIAVRFIRERRIIPYFLCVVIAGWFHNSAWVFLFFYFLPSRSLNRWIWSAVLIVGLVAGLMNAQFGYIARTIPIGFVQSYVESYMGNKTFVPSEIGVVRIVKVILAIVMLFRQKEIVRHYPLAIPVLIFYMCSQLSYLLLSDIAVLQGRFGEMFAAFEVYSLAMFPMISRKYYYALCAVPVVFLVYQHVGETVNLLTEAI